MSNTLKGFSPQRRGEGQVNRKKGVRRAKQTENAFCQARGLLRRKVSAMSVLVNNAIHIRATSWPYTFFSNLRHGGSSPSLHSFSAAAGETGSCDPAELRVNPAGNEVAPVIPRNRPADSFLGSIWLTSKAQDTTFCDPKALTNANIHVTICKHRTTKLQGTFSILMFLPTFFPSGYFL